MKKVLFTIVMFLIIVACKNNSKISSNLAIQTETITKYPSDVIPFMDKWKILLGDGTHVDDLINYQRDDFFYIENE